MKKLVIVLVVAVIALIVLNICIIHSLYFGGNKQILGFERIDTTINRLRIDSIQLVITERDTTIYNIKYDANEEVLESLNDNDSAAVTRFLELVK